MLQPSLTVAILAGGAGTRLGGRDKGLVDLAGTPLIAHAVRAIPAGAELLIVANRHCDEYARFGRVVSDHDRIPRGPLAGIASALSAVRTTWLATLPVDCPRVPRELVPRLMSQCERVPEHQPLVVHDGHRRQPLFALYHHSLAASAREALERDEPVWRWQDAEGAVEIDCSDVAVAFANLNTIEDFARWSASETHEPG